MHRNQQKTSSGGAIVLFIVLLNAIILEQGMTKDKGLYALLFITIPLFLISIIGSKHKFPSNFRSRTHTPALKITDRSRDLLN